MHSEDTLLDDFQEWLADMQTALDRFEAQLPEAVAEALDESPESLDILERWLLERYGSTEDVLAESEKEILDCSARYVGETLLEHLGGRWSISADNPKDANYQLPILTGIKGEFSTLSPVTLVTAAADRRTGTYLSTILRTLLKR